jgi:hypothetical protein
MFIMAYWIVDYHNELSSNWQWWHIVQFRNSLLKITWCIFYTIYTYTMGRFGSIYTCLYQGRKVSSQVFVC